MIHEIKSPRLTINEEKTVLATKKYKRMVTGLILTNEGAVSIGHERKRIIRASIHHAQQGKLNHLELMHLSGLLVFAQDVEPEFFHRMVSKYGISLIDSIKASKK